LKKIYLREYLRAGRKTNAVTSRERNASVLVPMIRLVVLWRRSGGTLNTGTRRGAMGEGAQLWRRRRERVF